MEDEFESVIDGVLESVKKVCLEKKTMAKRKEEPVADTYKCLSIIEGSTETMKHKDFRKYLLRKVGPEVYYSWFMQGIFKELPGGKEEFTAPNAWAATRWQELFKWMNKANDYLNGKPT